MNISCLRLGGNRTEDARLMSKIKPTSQSCATTRSWHLLATCELSRIFCLLDIPRKSEPQCENISRASEGDLSYLVGPLSSMV